MLRLLRQRSRSKLHNIYTISKYRDFLCSSIRKMLDRKLWSTFSSKENNLYLSLILFGAWMSVLYKPLMYVLFLNLCSFKCHIIVPCKFLYKTFSASMKGNRFKVIMQTYNCMLFYLPYFTSSVHPFVYLPIVLNFKTLIVHMKCFQFFLYVYDREWFVLLQFKCYLTQLHAQTHILVSLVVPFLIFSQGSFRNVLSNS